MTTTHWAVHLDTSDSAQAPALTEFNGGWAAQTEHYDTADIPAHRVSSVSVDIPPGAAAVVNGLTRSGPDIFTIDSGHPESLLGQSVSVAVITGSITVVVAAPDTFHGSLSLS